MKSIDSREFRRQASRYLREVERGDSIEVTDRGRPVARLVPLPRSSRVNTLLATGQLSRSAGDLLALGAPLEPRRGVPLPSIELASMREDER